MRWKAAPGNILILLSLACAPALLAQTSTTIQYFYDDLGRLTKVVDPAGNIASYTYDAVGNLLSIARSQLSSPGALAIFNFTPQRGVPGGTVTIQGQGFSATPADDTVKFNGTIATVVSAIATQLVVTVPPGATTGPISVTVAGVTAQGDTFTVLVPSVPSIASLSPSSAIVGGAAFILTVNGSNFVSGSVVQWNGSNRTTGFLGSGQLTASISASDIAAVGIAQVTVLNPPPNGVTSNAATFTINNPTPAITFTLPSSATPGGGDFTLTVFGSNFVSTSVVQWNGSSRTTTFVSSTEVTAAISSSDIATAGLAQVTVVNPTPGGGTSNSLTFTIGAITAPGPRGVVGQMDVANDGTPDSCGAVTPATSGNGRFVAFDSCGALVPEDTNNTDDIYLRDSCQGAPAGCTPATILISVASDGTAANSASHDPAVSADGRFVAFDSLATNLVPNDANNAADVFLRDTCIGAPAGCTPSTILISVASDGTQGSGPSDIPSVSADGRFVAFESFATNLVPGDTNNQRDIFVRDTCIGAPAGCTPSTTRVSVASDGSQATGCTSLFCGNFQASISGDGRFVAFASDDTNLVTNDTNNQRDVFVHDTCAGAPAGCTPSTFRVSVASDGSEANGGSDTPAISANGRVVAFISGATNLAAGANGSFDILVHDTCFGVTSGCIPSTQLVSGTPSGVSGNSTNDSPTISADGRFVAFSSVASNLVPNDTNNETDIFVRDTCIGAVCTPSTLRVSVALDGTQSNGFSEFTAISADGHFVAFASGATNLVPRTSTIESIFLALTGF